MFTELPGTRRAGAELLPVHNLYLLSRLLPGGSMAVRLRTPVEAPPVARPAVTPGAPPQTSGDGREVEGGPDRLRRGAKRIGALIIGLGLFVTALGVMKAGAAALIPSLQGSIFTDNPWS